MTFEHQRTVVIEALQKFNDTEKMTKIEFGNINYFLYKAVLDSLETYLNENTLVNSSQWYDVITFVGDVFYKEAPVLNIESLPKKYKLPDGKKPINL